MKSSRSAQKRCCPSPVCFGALHWCFAESGCHGDKSINPRGFPNDWQKHTFNPLQGYYTGMTRRGVIELLYFPLFCRTCWCGGGGHLIQIESSHSLCVIPPQLSCSYSFFHSGPVRTTLCTNCCSQNEGHPVKS